MAPIMSVEDIAYVRFAAPDLAEMEAFLTDFGLDCIEVNGVLYARGKDGRAFLHATERGEAAFVALGLRASSELDLIKLAEAEKTIMEQVDAPGGGSVVRLTDPDGVIVEVIAGQAEARPTPPGPDPLRNSASQRLRLRQTVRASARPSQVQRLGHCVLNASDFRISEQWYKSRFGFLTSDELEVAPGVSVGAFLRCNRGSNVTDHHTLFLAQAPQPAGFLHAAFEVENLDDLMLGHTYMKRKNRDQAWGVGRHILGSQIFDYWRDPWGHELEHWTDGDLLTADDPPRIVPMSDLLEVQWGPGFPLPDPQ